MATIYKFIAKTEEEYTTLANYAVTLSVTATLFPAQLTVAIPDEAGADVVNFINEGNLDITSAINQTDVDGVEALLNDPTTDVTILREIALSAKADLDASAEEKAKLATSLEGANHDRELYRKWYNEAQAENSRVREQVNAISVLLNAIFPRE